MTGCALWAQYFSCSPILLIGFVLTLLLGVGATTHKDGVQAQKFTILFIIAPILTWPWLAPLYTLTAIAAVVLILAT